jgi:mannuronan synthase
LKSTAVAALSLFLITASATFLYQRITQSTELLPIFIEQATLDMKATTAGQISYLNPDAQQGEVVFSINANSGDVLNFQLPCDCKIMVADGIFEGATVLPIDDVLSLLQDGAGIRVQTQISVEGLAKVMNGEVAYLDLADGRSFPVRVATSSATNAAAHRGEAFVPVYLVPEEGVLTDADVGKAAQLRLSKPWFNNSFFDFLE